MRTDSIDGVLGPASLVGLVEVMVSLHDEHVCHSKAAQAPVKLVEAKPIRQEGTT